MVMSVDNLGSEFHRDALSQGVELCQRGETDNGIWLFLVVVGLVVWAVAGLLTPGVPGG